MECRLMMPGVQRRGSPPGRRGAAGGPAAFVGDLGAPNGCFCKLGGPFGESPHNTI